MTQEIDISFMQFALDIATRASMATSPNPKVGCVIVKDGIILGQGWTQPLGQAHAEVMALRDAAMRGVDVQGATAYVSLEPCSHFGRTPPCANALIEAGIARVVAAVQDANPQVAGAGLRLLREAGIAVECGILADQARELNVGFFKRMESGRPWVRMKVAASLDGHTALRNGQSKWITSARARQDGHGWRARSDAILTGIGTVLADDPQLNVRDVDGLEVGWQPRKIVLDTHLRISKQAKLWQGDNVTIVHASDDMLTRESLEQAGAKLLYLPARDGQIDLPALLSELGKQQLNELHVEAGATLNGALIAQHCVDELVLYLAPKIFGDGAGMFSLPQLQAIDQARKVYFHEVKQIGDTLRILARFN